MRVSSHVALVDGPSRSAIYNISLRSCIPVDHITARILRCLAGAHSLKTLRSIFQSKQLFPRIAHLANLGVVTAGSPRTVNLDIQQFISQRKPSTVLENVWLEITERCNLVCGHCYSSSSPDALRSEMSIKEWKNIVDKFLHHGCRKFTLIGGEPLTEGELVHALCSHIRNYSTSTDIVLFSNLNNVKWIERYIKFLKYYDIRIGTSLYAISGPAHDNFVCSISAWARTIRSLKLLVAHDIDVFVGYYRVHAGNDESEIARFFKELGILKYEILDPISSGRWKGEAKPSEESRPNDRGLAFFDAEPWPDNIHNCFVDHMSVRANGDVNPCIMIRNIRYGNLKEEDIADASFSQEWRRIASIGKARIDICNECERRFACFDCRPKSIDSGRGLSGKPHCGYDPLIGS